MASADVATRGLDQAEQAEAIRTCRDVYGGTLRLRQERTRYLPEQPREEERAYSIRLQKSVLFEAYRRTVSGLTGLIMRRPPRLAEDLPGKLADWIVPQVAGIADRVIRELLIAGHHALVVDLPRSGDLGDEMVTLADERRMAEAPRWMLVDAEDIVAARTAEWSEGHRLTHLRVMRASVVPRDRWEEKIVKKVIVYDQATERVPVEAEVWVQEDGKEWTVEWEGVLKGMEQIPAVGVHAELRPARWGFSQPPLIGLAHENIKHYQTRSDRDTALQIASVPIFTISGNNIPDDIVVSADQGLKLPEGGKAEIVESRGHALGASRQELQDTEQRMAALGLALLQRETRMAETARSRQIDEWQSGSALQVVAKSTQDAMAEAMRITARWTGWGDVPDNPVTLHDDFSALVMDAQTASVMLKAFAAGAMPIEALWASWQRGELLPPDFDYDVAKGQLMEAAAEIVQLPPPPTEE